MSEDNLVFLTRIYRAGLRAGFALFPLMAIAYLQMFGPSQLFLSYGLHEAAISASIAISAFVSVITWYCYRISGEPLLRWVAQGLTGFTLVYLPHGVMTRMAECNIWLFLLYGPVSRIIMACCLFIGLLHLNDEPDSSEVRLSTKKIWIGIAVFLVIDLVVAYVSYSPLAGKLWLRLSMEIVSILLALIGIGIVHWRHITSPLIQIYAFSLALFAQSSISFCLSKPWGHQWWLAHVIFAGGFFTLSYGIIQAFLTTRSFANVYSQEEMMNRLTKRTQELYTKNNELEAALGRVKQLEGIIPICMYCKKIRDTEDSWHQLEKYISEHSEAMFSHGMCPVCSEEQRKLINEMKACTQPNNSQHVSF